MKVIEFKKEDKTENVNKLFEQLSKNDSGIRYGVFVGVSGETREDYQVHVRVVNMDAEGVLGLLSVAKSIVLKEMGF